MYMIVNIYIYDCKYIYIYDYIWVDYIYMIISIYYDYICVDDILIHSLNVFSAKRLRLWLEMMSPIS